MVLWVENSVAELPRFVHAHSLADANSGVPYSAFFCTGFEQIQAYTVAIWRSDGNLFRTVLTISGECGHGHLEGIEIGTDCMSDMHVPELACSIEERHSEIEMHEA